MNLAQLLSMIGFALVASITPGPVNMIGIATGVKHGLRAGLIYVWGATAGFTLLLIGVGFGLQELSRWLPSVSEYLRWFSVLFLLYLAWGVARSAPNLSADDSAPASAFSGALLQWLNPKAWLGSVGGMSAFNHDGSLQTLWIFVIIYFVVCFLSLACWACAGAYLSRYLQQPRYLKLFNLTMAGLLVVCAAVVGLQT